MFENIDKKKIQPKYTVSSPTCNSNWPSETIKEVSENELLPIKHITALWVMNLTF